MKTSTFKKQEKPWFTIHQILEGIEGIAIMIACYLTLFLKPFRDRWGCRKAEADQNFPVDNLVDTPNNQFTHAIEINAPAEDIWPWVAQIGQGRGGFYSYEALENLAGMQICNADEILPEFQNPHLGDLIPFSAEDGYPLVYCESEKGMAISFYFDLKKNKVFVPNESFPSNYFQLTWLWFIKPIDKQRSSFFSRNRIAFTPSLKNKLILGLLSEPIIFAMDRKMCLGIKKRAEKLFVESEKGYNKSLTN